jgi:hypothetical protein
MSRIGKKPVQVPAGVTATVEGQKVTAKGPKGELFFVANDEVVRSQLEDNADLGGSRSTIARTLAPSGACPARWSRIIFKGVKDGYEKQARNHRRRLPRVAAGQEPAASARLLPRRRSTRRRKASRSLCPKPTEIIISRASTSSSRRPGRRGDPRIPRPRALQGQGRQVRRRAHRPQGRQEEVRITRNG